MSIPAVAPAFNKIAENHHNHKTPISQLQETCTKRGITPQYDLIANEGAVHEPVFVFRCCAGGAFVGSGKGPSKKKAKHNAAQAVLNMLEGAGGDGDACLKPDPNDETSQAVPVQDGIPNNPIGELQEFTQKRLLRPPIYNHTCEQGPPHAREFVCTVKLGKLSSTGTGKSKKIAKRNAAMNMLQNVATSSISQEDLDVGEDEEDIQMGNSNSAYNSLKDGKRLPTLTPNASKQISAFYSQMKSSTGKKLSSLHACSLNSPATNYCQLLQEIAEEQRFEVTYVDLQEPGASGHRQCLVQLSTMPVAVCHGVGPTPDDTRANAAHNALQYLKIMTKKA